MAITPVLPKKGTDRKPTAKKSLPTQRLVEYGQSDSSGDEDDDVHYVQFTRS